MRRLVAPTPFAGRMDEKFMGYTGTGSEMRSQKHPAQKEAWNTQ